MNANTTAILHLNVFVKPLQLYQQIDDMTSLTKGKALYIKNHLSYGQFKIYLVEPRVGCMCLQDLHSSTSKLMVGYQII